VNDVCARPRVISGFGVERPFGLSEETSLRAVEGTLNVGVFGKVDRIWDVGILVSVGFDGGTTGGRMKSSGDGAVGLSPGSHAIQD
jgi:hypothetical protein